MREHKEVYERLIMKRDIYEQNRKNDMKKLIKITSIAASVALIVAVIPLSIRVMNKIKDDVIDSNKQLYPEEAFSELLWGASDETGTAEMKSSSFYGIKNKPEKYSAYRQDRVIAEELVGEKIDEIEVVAGWTDNIGTEYNAEEKLRAEVYTVMGVDRDKLLCVRYLDKGDALTTDHYYAWVPDFTGEGIDSFGELLDAYNVTEYMDGVVFSVFGKDGYYEYTYDGGDIKELLAGIDGEKTVVEYKELKKIITEKCKKQATLKINMKDIGITKFEILVIDEGYAAYNTDGLVFFDIGKENAEKIISFIEENKDNSVERRGELITVYTDAVE